MIVVRTLFKLTPIFLSFLLASCNTLTPEDAVSTEISGNDEAQVIDSLVSEAANFGTADITGEHRKLPSEQAESLIHIVEESVEPITPSTPTVAMTANRVVELAVNDYLQNRQSTLRIWIERGHTYFPMIEETFADEGIPDELKYIALGESGLRPTARSSAGAAGMWQFMPATGRGAGLTINAWVDERRDPEKASRAAAQHLKELYETYSGNWHLALAGYNCSYRCISRAVRRAGGSIDNPPSFWEIYPYLPRETRGFIPKFIAASLLVSNPEMYGISADTFGEELAYDFVEVNGMLNLEDAAGLAGIDLSNLRALNPELLRNTLPDSTEPYALKIPQGSYQRFVAAFNNLPEEKKVPPSEYVVKSGDTLGQIARKFDTDVEALQSVNNIRNHLIHPSQKLLIPGTGFSSPISLVASNSPHTVNFGEASFRPIKLTDEFQLVELDGSTEEKPLIAVSLSADAADDFLVVPTIYQVRRGDTLGQIADQFNVSVRNIQAWNNVAGTLIRVGQELTLHTGAAPRITRYQVKSGDNLGSIARRFGVSVNNLKRWNDLSNDIIYPGQNLQLN